MSFKAVDVLVPPAVELLLRLFGQDVLEGRVLDETSSGGSSSAHVAVKIRGLDEPVVVPRSKLLTLPKATA